MQRLIETWSLLEEIQYNNNKVITMMKNYGESVEINHNLTWPYIPHYLYRILINCGLRSGKNNVLLNVLCVENQQPDVHKMYLYVKVPFE